MYQFVNSLCLGRTTGSQWQELDISEIAVKDIFNNFSKIYLTLFNVSLDSNIYTDFNLLRNEFSNYADTLNELLIFLDNRTLIALDSIPNSNIKYVKYSDAVRANYKVNLTKVGLNLPDNYPIADLTDIEITRPDYETDMSLLQDYCLLSVNGFIHNTDTDGEKTYIYDAAISLNKSKSNHIGILSFLDIGKLTKVKILEQNIHAHDDTSFLKDKVYFSVDENLDNKSYILVLGGYLIFPDENIFWKNGNNSFVLNLNHIQYIERIFETEQYMDLTSLGLTSIPINDSMLNIDELWSDDVIKKYMTMSQSFLVVIDIANLFTNKIVLKTTNMPGMFISYTEPTYPLIVNYGKLAEYWKTFEDGYWSVTIEDGFAKNYILSEQPYYQLGNVTDAVTPFKSFSHSRGFLLEIAGYNF